MGQIDSIIVSWREAIANSPLFFPLKCLEKKVSDFIKRKDPKLNCIL